MATEFHIEDSFRGELASLGLVDYRDFMSREIGELVTSSPERGRDVRRVFGQKNTFYLKRNQGQKWNRSLELLLVGMKPHMPSYREMQHVQVLRDLDIPVMRVAAYGERRRFGLPRDGFLLLEAVPGGGLVEAFQDSLSERRTALLIQCGYLLGQLHGHGCFNAPRLNDVIVTGWPDGDIQLVLIDREMRSPFPKRVSRRRCYNSLLRCCRSFSKNNIQLTQGEIIQFLSAYNSVSPKRLSDSERRSCYAELTNR